MPFVTRLIQKNAFGTGKKRRVPRERVGVAGFRQGAEWARWKKRHRDELNSCGIPPSLLKTQRRWWYFLDHGYDEASGWNPTALSREQAVRLVAFLRAEYPLEDHRCCIDPLRQEFDLE